MEIVAGLPLKYLRLESTSAPMNIVSVCEYEANTQMASPSIDALRRYILNKLSALPFLRQRLIESPFHFASPVWLDDPHMDIVYHVNEINISHEDEETRTLNDYILKHVAKIASKKLDRGSPLWRIDIIRSLSENTFALVLVAHKALACRLEQPFFDLIFKQDTCIREIDTTNLPIEPKQKKHTGFFSSTWFPESMPSRNDLLGMAKKDWLSLPQQGKEISQMMLSAWAKKKLNKSLIPKSSYPPEWISAPKTLFNQPIGPDRSLYSLFIQSEDARLIRRPFKKFQLRDLIFVLIARSLKEYLNQKLHHTKEELIALVQCSALFNEENSSDICPSKDDYQLLRLPTNAASLNEQLNNTLERRQISKEYYMDVAQQSNITMIPSSLLTFFIKTYEKLNGHKLHNPICNLVISEQQKNQHMSTFNGFQLKKDLHFASLLPNIGLHICYWIQNGECCITLNASSPSINAHELGFFFEKSLDSLRESVLITKKQL